ncbi:MAG: hypothetical protein HYZ17_16505 [Betaproteobacteria bacterium]|nr:hypothetical protein [Betaproteobacteria bacterium]
MSTDFPTAPLASGHKGAGGGAVEKSPSASHTKNLTLPSEMVLRSMLVAEPAYEPLLAEWIRLYPKSYLARVSRAFYHIDAGYAKRGSKFADKTSEEQFQAMSREFVSAGADLDVARGLHENPTLVYALRIRIARASSINGPSQRLIDEGLSKFPKSLAIRTAAAASLNPKWGGSFEALDRLAASSRSVGMPEVEARTVAYHVAMEKGNYLHVVTKQLARAAAYYREAGALCRSFEAWRQALRASYEIEDWATVNEAANHALEIEPTNVLALERRALALEHLGKTTQSLRDYETATTLGSSWAPNKLGWLYWQGKEVPRDLRRARAYFVQANERGAKGAGSYLIALDAALKSER